MAKDKLFESYDAGSTNGGSEFQAKLRARRKPGSDLPDELQKLLDQFEREARLEKVWRFRSAVTIPTPIPVVPVPLPLPAAPVERAIPIAIPPGSLTQLHLKTEPLRARLKEVETILKKPKAKATVGEAEPKPGKRFARCAICNKARRLSFPFCPDCKAFAAVVHEPSD